MTNHAILSPSAAHRWLACPPSARFEEQIPEGESVYAAEGTLAHELAALLLGARSGTYKGSQKAFNDELDKITAHELYSSDMREHCEAYVEFVMEKRGEVLIEHSYDLSEFIPLGHGTADATVMTKGIVYVIDFKYGAGVRVAATANKQMMCYGLGALREAKHRGMRPIGLVLSIFQPRAGGHSSWEISVEDLLKWAETEVKPRALLAIAGRGDFTPGGHCQFCKARSCCKAFYDRFADMYAIRDKRVITDEELVRVLTEGSLIASWIKKVETDTIKRLSEGNPLTGFKLVNGRGRRSFKDEDQVVDTLLGEGFGDEIFNSSLKSLTAIEKLLGKKRFAELFSGQIENIPGALQIAPESDPRPAVDASAADEYDDNLV